jgi:hypothetical protein
METNNWSLQICIRSSVLLHFLSELSMLKNDIFSLLSVCYKECNANNCGIYMQVTRYTRFRYPRFRISAVLFQCQVEHQCSIRGPYFNACVKPSFVLSRNVMQMISLVSEKSDASLTAKWRFLYVSRFTHFEYTRRFAGTQPLCITRVTCCS